MTTPGLQKSRKLPIPGIMGYAKKSPINKGDGMDMTAHTSRVRADVNQAASHIPSRTRIDRVAYFSISLLWVTTITV